MRKSQATINGMNNSNTYVSSIISLHGDADNVWNDSKVLKEILDRQGSNLLIHVLAESVGNAAIKYNLTSEEVNRVLDSLVRELTESVKERT